MNENQNSTSREYGEPHSGWRRQVYRVVFESDTSAGVLFDKVLVFAIVASIFTVILDSVPSLHARWAKLFGVMEWGFTLLFTVEYLLRIICLRRPMRYAGSFYGVVDMLAVLPTYLVLFFPHVTASARKIQVFLSVVVMVVVVMGSVMYVVEGPENGFTSIPTSIYWAITTMTTVGFGDIAPKTELGRLISSMMMLIGWGTLAVPTGIVTSELAFRRRFAVCDACGAGSQDPYAKFCSQGGAAM